MSKEAMKLALEALEDRGELSANEFKEKKNDAITAIKEALAQPEQEPVAWIYKSEPSFDGNKWHDTFEVTTSKQVALWKDKTAKPLYTTPPQRTWVGLSLTEQADCYANAEDGNDFYKAIEAKLKEKND